MATITTLLKPAHGNSPRGRTPYYVDMSIDLTAQAISCTGGDVVQCLTIPANTRVLHAGFQVVESATMNTGTNATAILGAAMTTNLLQRLTLTVRLTGLMLLLLHQQQMSLLLLQILWTLPLLVMVQHILQVKFVSMQSCWTLATKVMYLLMK